MFVSSRRNARITAFQILYQRAKIGVREEEEKQFFEQIGFHKNYRLFSLELIDVAWRERKEIDEAIQKHLFKWKQNRILETLNALLRISVAELLFFPKTDAKVVFNEAIEICREYVGEKATKICNGALHAIWRSKNPDIPQVDGKTPETDIKPDRDEQKTTEILEAAEEIPKSSDIKPDRDEQKTTEILEAAEKDPKSSKNETPEISKGEELAKSFSEAPPKDLREPETLAPSSAEDEKKRES